MAQEGRAGARGGEDTGEGRGRNTGENRGTGGAVPGTGRGGGVGRTVDEGERGEGGGRKNVDIFIVARFPACGGLPGPEASGSVRRYMLSQKSKWGFGHAFRGGTCPQKRIFGFSGKWQKQYFLDIGGERGVSFNAGAGETGFLGVLAWAGV